MALLSRPADQESQGPVQRHVLARHARISEATVGDCMGFLSDVGLVRASRGVYAVTDAGSEFAELWTRDSARARLLLHTLLAVHWSAAAAGQHLAEGPLPQEELATRLRTGLPGVPLRGTYLVEWLVIGLVLVRDEQLRVHLAPAGGAAPAQDSDNGCAAQEGLNAEQTLGFGEAGPGPDPAEPSSGTALLGLTRQDIQALPDTRYTAFLDGILQSLRGAHAPTA
ncbi:hypothetical protein ACIQZN_25275 [Streptomyces sp. NPDC097595]|uniref:hypothetical protein n=1 Tax=Streptomyces sp. NPDC097595 TaxID=3366090 RepID=UPI0037F771BC